MGRQLRVIVAAVAAVMGTALTTGASYAADSMPVVELFTSQGCSSCPPADKLFESYAKRTDVVALSFAVDYWDYLGWKDTLASPKYSERQREYARGRGDGQVYTPQMIINGRDHAVGSNRATIEAALAKSASALKASPIGMTLTADGKGLDVESRSGAAGAPQPATIWIVSVAPKQLVRVTRGENSGRDLTYFNVVRDIVPIGTWAGTKATLAIDRSKLPKGDGMRHAALVQAGKGGPLVAAAWLD